MPVSPIHILVIEDDLAQSRLLEELLSGSLEHHFEVSCAGRIAEAQQRLSERRFDALLLDLSLPDSQGLETVQHALRLAPHTPIIVMTGLDDEQLALEAVRSGAQDYLVKGQVEGRLLVRALRYAIERAQMLQELRQNRDELERRVQERTADLAETVNALQAEVLDRRKAEASLREYQQYLHQVLMGSPLLLWAVDRNGILTVLEGKALFELVKPNELAQLVGTSIFTPNFRLGRVRRQVEAALRGQDVLAEMRIGGRIVEMRLSPLRDESGQIVGVIGVSLDITQRRQLEQEVLEIGSTMRQSIGQDLHDSLGQTLTGLAFMCKVLQRKLVNKTAHEGDADELIKLATLAVGQTRTLARGLCPVDLKAEGLMTALQELAVNCQNILGAGCRFECPDNVLIHDNATATHLYHIAQEAISNAVKHGRARNVEIRLCEQNSLLTLSVQDDGKGIDSVGPRGNGMGMKIMDYRARVIGGNLAIQPGEPKGTLVTCTLRRGAAAQT